MKKEVDNYQCAATHLLNFKIPVDVVEQTCRGGGGICLCKKKENPEKQRNLWFLCFFWKSKVFFAFCARARARGGGEGVALFFMFCLCFFFLSKESKEIFAFFFQSEDSE